MSTRKCVPSGHYSLVVQRAFQRRSDIAQELCQLIPGFDMHLVQSDHVSTGSTSGIGELQHDFGNVAMIVSRGRP